MNSSSSDLEQNPDIYPSSARVYFNKNYKRWTVDKLSIPVLRKTFSSKIKATNYAIETNIFNH